MSDKRKPDFADTLSDGSLLLHPGLITVYAETE